jgi:hypothetical protein
MLGSHFGGAGQEAKVKMSTIDRRTAEAGEPRYSEAIQADSWLVFAGTIFLFTGLWNVFEGFVALFRSAFFTGTPVFGTIAFWGSVLIGVGILGVAAGYGILGGRTWARWFGIVVVSLIAIAHMFAIAFYPWWSLFILAVDIAILYALAVHWPQKSPATAAR